MTSIRNKYVKKRKKIELMDIFSVTILTIFGLTILIPFYYTFLISITPEAEFYKNPLLLYPKVVDFYSYEVVFRFSGLGKGFLNSIFVVIFGVTYNMFLTVTMAYGFSKKKFPGRNLLFNLVIVTMYFGGGLIPFYLVVKSLKLINSLAVLIIPTGLSAFNMIIVKNYFQGLPKEMEESAKIDGAGDIRILWQIILPLSLPVLATFTLFYSVDRWNEWFNAMIFINSKDKYPIQLALREILNQAQGVKIQETGYKLDNVRKVYSEGVKMASIVVVMGPIMLVYPFLQKYFMKGILIGAIKA